MTRDNANNDEWGIDRRTLLKGAATASVAGFVGVPAFSGSAVAQSSGNIYLIDMDTDGEPATLYSVEFSGGDAILNEEADTPYGLAHIAGSPDGETIYRLSRRMPRGLTPWMKPTTR